MNMNRLMTQQDNIGVSRTFNEGETDHILCLLRLIEQLPAISDLSQDDSPELIARKLSSIHKNHCELASAASKVMNSAAPNIQTDDQQTNH